MLQIQNLFMAYKRVAVLYSLLNQIQSECGDEQADAGRDCRTRLARPNSQARREILIFPVQLTTSRIGNLAR